MQPVIVIGVDNAVVGFPSGPRRPFDQTDVIKKRLCLAGRSSCAGEADIEIPSVGREGEFLVIPGPVSVSGNVGGDVFATDLITLAAVVITHLNVGIACVDRLDPAVEDELFTVVVPLAEFFMPAILV